MRAKRVRRKGEFGAGEEALEFESLLPHVRLRRSQGAHLGWFLSGFVYCMEHATKADVDFSGVHSTAAEFVSIARHFCATRVWSPLSWPRRGGGGNAPLSSKSTTFSLRSYLEEMAGLFKGG